MTAKELMQASLEREVAALIASAEAHGFVVTIETVATLPLAMGNHRMVGTVRVALAHQPRPTDTPTRDIYAEAVKHIRSGDAWIPEAFGKRGR